VHTATGLGLPCIGIGTGGRAERLETAGASRVFPDFTNLDTVLNALEDADRTSSP
jgi:phosphoglycolate phosphatase-like HAD superfamily hydrolase